MAKQVIKIPDPVQTIISSVKPPEAIDPAPVRNQAQAAQTGKDLGLRRKPKKKIRVQAMIPPELMEKLQATAEENDASVSEVAAKIIAKYFEG